MTVRTVRVGTLHLLAVSLAGVVACSSTASTASSSPHDASSDVGSDGGGGDGAAAESGLTFPRDAGPQPDATVTGPADAGDPFFGNSDANGVTDAPGVAPPHP
jgi:hypothetical protein